VVAWLKSDICRDMRLSALDVCADREVGFGDAEDGGVKEALSSMASDS
jgi:hypothetical protein